MRLAAARSSAPAVQSVVVSADRESGCQAECLGDACPDRQADDQKDPLPACRAAAAADRVPAYRASPRHRPSSVRKTCASYSCCAFPAVHRFFHIGIVTSLYPTCRVVKSVVGRAATCRVDSCGFCTVRHCHVWISRSRSIRSAWRPLSRPMQGSKSGAAPEQTVSLVNVGCHAGVTCPALYAVRRPPALTKRHSPRPDRPALTKSGSAPPRRHRSVRPSHAAPGSSTGLRARQSARGRRPAKPRQLFWLRPR